MCMSGCFSPVNGAVNSLKRYMVVEMPGWATAIEPLVPSELLGTAGSRGYDGCAGLDFLDVLKAGRLPADSGAVVPYEAAEPGCPWGVSRMAVLRDVCVDMAHGRAITVPGASDAALKHLDTNFAESRVERGRNTILTCGPCCARALN